MDEASLKVLGWAMAWSLMRPANGIVVLADAHGRLNSGLAAQMSDLVPFKANVRADEVLLGLEEPLCAGGKDEVKKLIDITAT